MQFVNNKISQQNRNSTPKFKANIYVVSEKEFCNLEHTLSTKDKLLMPNGFHIKNSIINTQNPTVSGDANDCSVAVLTNKDAKMTNISHIVPNQETFEKLDEIPEKIYNWGIELYEKTKTKLEGLIVGGKDFEAIKKRVCGTDTREAYKRSPILQDKILEAYEKLHRDIGLDYSVLGLQRQADSGVNVITDTKNNNHYMHMDGYYSAYNTIEGFANFLSNKKISKSDRIFFNNVDKTDEFRQLIDNENKARKE